MDLTYKMSRQMFKILFNACGRSMNELLNYINATGSFNGKVTKIIKDDKEIMYNEQK